MALSKQTKKDEKLAIYTKTLIDWSSPEAACKKLMSDFISYCSSKPEEGVSVGSLRTVFM